MKILLAITLLAGCATSQPEAFQLQTGEKVSCLRYAQAECGMTIDGCGDARSVSFECVKEVIYLGPEVSKK